MVSAYVAEGDNEGGPSRKVSKMKPSVSFLSQHPEPPIRQMISSREIRDTNAPGPWSGLIVLYTILSAADFRMGVRKMDVTFVSQFRSLVLVYDVA